LDFYLQGYSFYCALKKDMQSLAYSIRKSLSPIFKDCAVFTPNAAFQPGFIAWHNVAAIFLRASVGKAAARVTPYDPLFLYIQRNGKPSAIPLF